MLSLVFGPFYGLAFMSQRGTQQRVENATRRAAHRRNMQSMESLGLFHGTLTTSRATPFGNLAPTLIPQSLNKTSRNFGFLDSPFYDIFPGFHSDFLTLRVSQVGTFGI